MSPADLLRRAAAELREHAEATAPGPWRWIVLDPDRDGKLTYLVLGPKGAGRTPAAIPLRTETMDAGRFSQAEADVAFAVLMHPPVALALAEWLEAAFEYADSSLTSPNWPMLARAVDVARSVLREDGESA